jgi:hypothetical protein
MLDDLYDRDILEWAGQQAALLRRVARGERVNEVDWDHVALEIEDVGASELSAVRSHLRQLLLHLLKLHGWPGSASAEHWRNELDVFQTEAQARFAPSMRQRIDVAAIYQQARRAVGRMLNYGEPPSALPEQCPFSLDDLLYGDTLALVARTDPGCGQA